MSVGGSAGLSPNYDPRLEVTGSGSLLVYVPGIDGTGKLFYRQRPGLESRYRVATYQLRESATTMDTLVADLSELLDRIPDSRPVTLVGESFGGALAMSYALANPDAVRNLVILNSFPRFDPQRSLRLALFGVRAIPGPVMTLVRRATAFRLHSRFTHRSEIKKFMRLTAQVSRTGYGNRLRILRDYDLRERLPALAVPTLFLAADRDKLVPSVEQANRMQALVPGSQVRVLPGHGHICLIAPNLELAPLISSWLDERGSSIPERADGEVDPPAL